MRLGEKVAVITGADSGIGQAAAVLFAREGADVMVGYNTDEAGAAQTGRLVENAGRRAVVAQVDVGDPASAAAFLARCAAELGTPDILVANAGQAMSDMPVADMDDDKMARILRVDLMGPVFCARPFIRARRTAGGRGRIVVVGSVAGHLPTPGSAPYGMAKSGVNSLVRSLSRELAPDRINVNCVAPGLIETPMTQKRMDDPAAREKSMEAIPWGRPGQPEEIAEVILFLAADTGDYVTGQTWVMDGGLTMHWGGA